MPCTLDIKFKGYKPIDIIMKFLCLDTYIHHKNKIGFILMCQEKNIEYVISKSHADFDKDWDLVFIPSEYVDPRYFPNAKAIMYGPHSFIFVDGVWRKNILTFPSNCFYNVLCNWVKDLQEEFGGLSMVTKPIPFAVDVEKFKPRDQPKQYDCFVYFKQRHTDDLQYVTSILKKKNLTYDVIVYGKYKEEDYINTLHSSKFGIWIGRHESQGFAVEEALSCNVPLLVFDCTSMFQEYNEKNEICYKNELGRYSLKGTAIPYWDDTCGISFTKQEEFTSNLDRMLLEYTTFQPREYIKKTLSPIACIDRLLKEITPT
jgi:glycosyltransferase involved in cell wall biosynthesis